MGDNITFKKDTWGFIPVYIAFCDDAIIDYIKVYDSRTDNYYEVQNRTFNDLETAKQYIINKFNNIPK